MYKYILMMGVMLLTISSKAADCLFELTANSCVLEISCNGEIRQSLDLGTITWTERGDDDYQIRDASGFSFVADIDNTVGHTTVADLFAFLATERGNCSVGGLASSSSSIDSTYVVNQSDTLFVIDNDLDSVFILNRDTTKVCVVNQLDTMHTNEVVPNLIPVFTAEGVNFPASGSMVSSPTAYGVSAPVDCREVVVFNYTAAAIQVQWTVSGGAIGRLAIPPYSSANVSEPDSKSMNHAILTNFSFGAVIGTDVGPVVSGNTDPHVLFNFKAY